MARRPSSPVTISQPEGGKAGAVAPLGNTSVKPAARVWRSGLHLPMPRGVHQGKVRVRHDHLVTQSFQASGHPFTFRRGLDQNPSLRPGPPAPPPATTAPCGSPLDQLATLGHHTDLTCHLVDVDATWSLADPLLHCARERVFSRWGICATTLSGGSAASSHLSSASPQSVDEWRTSSPPSAPGRTAACPPPARAAVVRLI
jgi:hypothetical protein